MKKKSYLLAAALCLACAAAAQTPYFQQEVNYTIAVTLDDTAHTLSGTLEMEYINHSPQSLPFIYMHLWANAYQDRSTAFARQELRMGNTNFHFAKDKDLGNFSGLDFTADGQPATLVLDAEHPDLAKVFLPTPLPPGGRVRLSTPFALKIPASFSRLGHVGTSYQMTQWYPKPAVYDREGWHPMPYLTMGEFYSEFGRFDVSITLPQNYVVGATGTLETESELAFLRQKAAETTAYLDTLKAPATRFVDEPFPPSDTAMKTLRYTAEKVHDFAWFADKRFKVQKSAVAFPSGRTVDTWIMFTRTNEAYWKDAIGYMDRAVRFYSELVGEYPYPHATGVQSALSAGGGMEYPMITVIGYTSSAQALDEVLTHEVGHNWFYGILAFNERDHVWMDEGLNTYYDHRYTYRYYGKEGNSPIPDFLKGDADLSIDEMVYLYQARRDRDQAPATHSADCAPINYLLGGYLKPAVLFRHLEMYLGTPVFDEMMQGFYQQWQFKHPLPNDLRQHCEQATGKDLTWLFDGFLYSKDKMDYAVRRVRRTPEGYAVTVRNKAKIAAPFPLSGMLGDSILHTQWQEGFRGKKTLLLPGEGYDLIVADAQRYTLDLNRKNNQRRTSGAIPGAEPLRIQRLGTIENPKHTTLYWLPALAWNNYDKTMLGLALYNTTLPANPFEFALAPMYATGSRSLTGLAEAHYHIYPATPRIQRITLGVKARQFHYAQNFRWEEHLQYARVVPSLRVELGTAPKGQFSHYIQWRNGYLWTDRLAFTAPDTRPQKTRRSDSFHEWQYFAESKHVITPYQLDVRLEYQQYEWFLEDQSHLKASVAWQGAYTYKRKKRVEARIFAGGFIANTARNKGAISPAAFNLTARGFNDYRFDDNYFGRNEDEGLWSQQVNLREGGFKNVIGRGFALGRSNNYILALNLRADLPMALPSWLPIKPYFDIGYFDNAMPTGANDALSDQILWSGGLMLSFFGGRAEVYLPLLNSQNIQDRYIERGNYGSRISFSIDLNRAYPWQLLEDSFGGQ